MGGKPRIFAVLAAILLIVILFTTSAEASHEQAVGFVSVFRGGTIVAQYSNTAACTLTACHVHVTMPKRDQGRFLRWCGADSVVVTTPGVIINGVPCSGGGSWFIQPAAGTQDSAGNTVPHDSDVNVTVHAHLG